MRTRYNKIIVLMFCVACMLLSGCAKIRQIVDSAQAPTEPIKTTNENQYTIVNSENEIEGMILQTMKDNKTTCYFNVMKEDMILADVWAKAFDGIRSINVEYAAAQSGYNVFVTLEYWDNYPIVAAFEKNDTTFLNATQLELFDKYCDILGTCTSKTYTEYENELAIHDYLVSNITYSQDVEKENSAYDALIKGSSACGGYVESFKTLMDMLGIMNKAVSGVGNEENHGWNMVRLAGEWYHVDVTWDDPVGADGSISHKYFNVNDDDMALDHVWEAEKYPQARGTAYAYYTMSGMTQVSTQAELESFIEEKIAEKAEKIEFIAFSEVDINQALQSTGIAMDISYNIMKKTQFSVYDITVVYK